MGFAGRYHYGRDVCRSSEDCLNDERQYAEFMRASLSIFPVLILFTLFLSQSVQELAWGSLMKLFSLLSIEQSQSFFYSFF